MVWLIVVVNSILPYHRSLVTQAQPLNSQTDNLTKSCNTFYSGIETRYGCTAEYLVAPEISRFAPARSLDESPTTAERLAIYKREAPILGTAAARAELANYAASAGVDGDTLPAFITHLIVVSCTGFFAPGLDFMIARELGLARPPPVAR